MLLVGENVLQADDVGGQFGDVLLRRVDDGEAFIQLGQTLGGRVRAFIQVLPEPVSDAIEALVDGARQFRLPRDGYFRDRLQPPLQLGQFGVEMGRLRRAFASLVAAPRQVDNDDNQQRQQHKCSKAGEPQQKEHGVERDVTHTDGIFNHGQSYTAIRAR